MKKKLPERGDVVVSIQGRDAGRLYVVCEVQGERALLADGITRTRANPKKKNVRHLRLLMQNVSQWSVVWDKSFENRIAYLLKGLADKS